MVLTTTAILGPPACHLASGLAGSLLPRHLVSGYPAKRVSTLISPSFKGPKYLRSGSVVYPLTRSTNFGFACFFPRANHAGFPSTTNHQLLGCPFFRGPNRTGLPLKRQPPHRFNHLLLAWLSLWFPFKPTTPVLGSARIARSARLLPELHVHDVVVVPHRGDGPHHHLRRLDSTRPQPQLSRPESATGRPAKEGEKSRPPPKARGANQQKPGGKKQRTSGVLQVWFPFLQCQHTEGPKDQTAPKPRIAGIQHGAWKEPRSQIWTGQSSKSTPNKRAKA